MAQMMASMMGVDPQEMSGEMLLRAAPGEDSAPLERTPQHVELPLDLSICVGGHNALAQGLS